MTDSYCAGFNRAFGPSLGRGLIRHAASDFQVNEILGFEPSGHGEHIYLQIRKSGANTDWVAAQIARFTGVRSFDVGYAGKKDRHAVTVQWFSCWQPGKIDPDWDEMHLEGVELLQAVRHDRKLRRGGHGGNRFEIKVRQLNLDAGGSSLRERLDLISENGFPNYFGPQRFGHDFFNLVQADALLGGRKVPRKTRNIVISAARSYLFNRQLSDWIDNGAWLNRKSGWLYGLAPHRDIEVPDLDFRLHENDVDVDKWCLGLKALGIKAILRDLAVTPQDLAWELSGDNLGLSFSLQKAGK